MYCAKSPKHFITISESGMVLLSSHDTFPSRFLFFNGDQGCMTLGMRLDSAFLFVAIPRRVASFFSDHRITLPVFFSYIRIGCIKAITTHLWKSCGRKLNFL
jgi:hypothetical protein